MDTYMYVYLLVNNIFVISFLKRLLLMMLQPFARQN